MDQFDQRLLKRQVGKVFLISGCSQTASASNQCILRAVGAAVSIECPSGGIPPSTHWQNKIKTNCAWPALVYSFKMFARKKVRILAKDTVSHNFLPGITRFSN